MHSKLSQQFFVFILSVTLLLTIGWSNNYADVPSNSSVETESKERKADFIKLPLLQPSFKNISIIPLKSKAKESKITVQTTQKEQKKEVVITKATVAKYEVTAYYLHVRANTYRTSKILKVVKKGTILEVLKTTDNGWLQLKSGGYVHGGYAKFVSKDVKQSEQVKILSVKNIAVEPGKPTSTVISDSGLTEDHIAEIFKGTALVGHGLEKAILEIEEEYGINAYFTIAVMKLESGNGKSRIAKNKNNLFGLNAIDGDKYNKSFSFKTKGDSVRKFGQLISKNYVGKGYTTLEKVARKYCQANPKWSRLVKSIMKSDYRSLSKI